MLSGSDYRGRPLCFVGGLWLLFCFFTMLCFTCWSLEVKSKKALKHCLRRIWCLPPSSLVPPGPSQSKHWLWTSTPRRTDVEAWYCLRFTLFSSFLILLPPHLIPSSFHPPTQFAAASVIRASLFLLHVDHFSWGECNIDISRTYTASSKYIRRAN